VNLSSTTNQPKAAMMDKNDVIRGLNRPVGMGADKTRWLFDNAEALGLEVKVIEVKTLQPTLILPLMTEPALPKVHRRS
jgi:hypothetical protein